MNEVVEIIDFFCPDDPEKAIYITKIIADIEPEVLQSQLFDTFSKYGLVFNVTIHKSKFYTDNSGDAAGGCAFYAFVWFYSSRDARKARATLNNQLVINGRISKIRKLTRKPMQPTATGERNRIPLSLTKCKDLANHYLGFNGWKSEIVNLTNEISSDSSASACCCMKIAVPSQGVETKGFGVFEEKWQYVRDKANAVCKVKKFAQQRAFQNAFVSLLLALFTNGKVYVEIDTSSQECLLTDENPGVMVTDLAVAPDESDSENDEEDDDDLAQQLLMALENSILV
ncbi:RAD52 motif-containing protein 1-like isoform X2 [Tubulanus polymorphus]|uniref:RAD52 motif-containing protein 1-like isoform X2 n=1 Tax=Tubulanus polymorphus TaxID=672921 RepID=UPI003DA69963